jgi:hypothetical protein
MRRIVWSDLVERVSLGALAAVMAMMALGAQLGADTPAAGVPEINGASLSAGLGLLGAGMLWLRARRGSK